MPDRMRSTLISRKRLMEALLHAAMAMVEEGDLEEVEYGQGTHVCMYGQHDGLACTCEC